jgi:hypothetical protein
VGNLWSSTGQLLATATLSGESASGWQQVTFSAPVWITANTIYVAGYHTNTGHYAFNANYFTAALDNGPLSAPVGAGVYQYGSGGFPTQTYESANYWVDVIFTAGNNLLAAGGPAAVPDNSAPLTNSELQPIVQEPIAEWAVAGASQQVLNAMGQTEFVIANLQNGLLGSTYSNEIVIDANAAGYGWFVDLTPGSSGEYTPVGNHLQAVIPQAAVHMDLLTVVAHELGHIAGLPDVDSSIDDLMSGNLAIGVCRIPTVADVDAVLADGLWN